MMSDPDNFLSRWSRRKLEPPDERRDEQNAPDAKPNEAQAQTSAPSSQPPAESDKAKEQEPAFDPSTLPSLDSITAGSDIRDFLKPGVPLSLSRAALRRAWTSDPAIRDFIGIAENQWDFTNDSIAGFGPLDPAEVPRLLAQLMGQPGETEARAELSQPAPDDSPAKNDATGDSSDHENLSSDLENTSKAEIRQQVTADETTKVDSSQRNTENDAAQNDEAGRNLNYPAARHGHGRALPT